MKIVEIINEALKLFAFSQDDERKSQEQLAFMVSQGGPTDTVGHVGDYNVHSYQNYPHVYTLETGGAHVAQFGFQTGYKHPLLKYAYILPAHRKAKLFSGFLSVLKRNGDIFPILIDYAMTDNMIKTVESLTDFQKYWYNVSDGRKELYTSGEDPKYFSVKPSEYVEWVYLLE